MLSTGAHSFQSHFHLVFPFGLAGVIHLTHRPEVILIISFRGDNRIQPGATTEGKQGVTAKEIKTAEIEEDLGYLRGHSRREDPPPFPHRGHRKGKAQSTTKYLENQSVCPLVRIGTHAPPLHQASVYPHPGIKARGHSPAAEGVGGPNSDDWRNSLALCLLCDIVHRIWKETKGQYLIICAKAFANIYTKNLRGFLLYSASLTDVSRTWTVGPHTGGG
jgi:hypothetical protein